MKPEIKEAGKPDVKEEKVTVLEGTVTTTFVYKKKRHHAGESFKTEDKKLFSKLLTTKRIVK